MDDRLFFAAGSYAAAARPVCAKLFAVAFAPSFQLIEDIELHVEYSDLENSVASLKRYRDKQVLVAGTIGSLFVVEWTGSHFSILNSIKDVHTGHILGLETDPGRLLTGCPKDNHINEIIFIE